MRVSWKQSVPTAYQRWIVEHPVAAWLIGGLGGATACVVLPLAYGVRSIVLLMFWLFVVLYTPLLIWLLQRQVRRWDASHSEERG